MIIEYQIEENHVKIIPGSKLLHHTDKYIDMFTWFHISTMIDNVIKGILQNEIDWKTNSKGKFSLDSTQSALNLRICYRIMPKDESRVDMKKIKYNFDWFLKIKIFNDSHSKKSVSKQNSTRSTPNISPTRIKPKDEQIEHEVVTITSSQEMDIEDLIKPTTLRKARSGAESTPLQSRSTRSNDSKNKPMTRAHSNLNSKLDADFQSNAATEEIPVVQDQKRIKVEKCQKKLDTWLTSVDAREMCNERSNVTKRKKERNYSEKTPEKSKSQPLQLIDPQQMEKIENFVESRKLKEAEKEIRKHELKDLEIWNCHDLTKEKLREIIEAHKSEIEKLFSAPHRSRTNPTIKNLRFNSLLINTSDTISDDQQLYVLKLIEKCIKNITTEGRDDNLHEVVLPYATVVIFKEKYNLSLKEALERIEKQEEKKNLYNLNNLYDSR